MAANNKVEFELSVKDNASAAAKKVADEVGKSFSKTEKESQKQSQTTSRALSQSQRERQRMLSATERLGIRSEKAIQREIKATEAAYKRLSQSGKASANDLARAQAAAKNRIAELNAEMGKTSKLQQRMNTGMSIGKGVVAAGAGAWAAYQVVDPQLQARMNRDRDRRSATNILADGGSLAERQAILTEVKQAARGAAKLGGSEDEAIGSINTLAAGGGLNKSQIFDASKTIAKVQVATVFDASQQDLALAAGSMIKFGIQAKELEDTFGMLVTSGNEGAFEIADMAKELPDLLANAQNLGMTGKRDLALITTLAQTSRMTAGTSPEAATVASRYLSAINSASVKKAISGASGMKVADIEKQYALGLENGKSVMETNTEMVKRIVEADPQYKKMTALRDQLKTTKDSGERESILAQQMKLLEGTVAGEIFPDLLSRKGFMGMFNNSEDFSRILEATLKSDASSIEPAYQFGKESEYAQYVAAQSKRNELQEDSIAPVAEAMNKFRSTFVDYANKYPTAATAIEGTTSAFTALTYAMAGAGLSSMLMGGKGGLMGKILGGLGNTAAGRAGGGVAKGVLGAAAGEARLLVGGLKQLNVATKGAAGYMAGIAAAGVAGYAAGTMIHDKIDSTENGQVFLDSLGERLTGIMAFFGSKEAQQAQENNAVGNGLIKNDVTNYADMWKNRQQSMQDNPLSGVAEQIKPALTTAATDFNTSAASQKQAADIQMQAANALQKAMSTPIKVDVNVRSNTNAIETIQDRRS